VGLVHCSEHDKEEQLLSSRMVDGYQRMITLSANMLSMYGPRMYFSLSLDILVRAGLHWSHGSYANTLLFPVMNLNKNQVLLTDLPEHHRTQITAFSDSFSKSLSRSLKPVSCSPKSRVAESEF
jgi:hypothetical protein